MMSRYGNYRQRKFTDLYPDADTFVTAYNMNPLKTDELDDDRISEIYYYLYCEYGNNVIGPSDENRFAFKVFSIIRQYAPTMFRELAIQKELRTATTEDLRKGTKAIHNHAENPQMAPGTGTLEELSYIDNQNTSNLIKGTIETLMDLKEGLDDGIVDRFIRRFKPLFLMVVTPDLPLWYGSDNEEES